MESGVHPSQLEIVETWQVALNFGVRKQDQCSPMQNQRKQNQRVTVGCIFTVLKPELTN